MELHSNIDSKFKGTSLTNFIQLLFISLEKKNYPMFEMLQKKFDYYLSRDPSFEKYLKMIAQVFFGIQEQDNSLGGLLSGFLNNFMGN